MAKMAEMPGETQSIMLSAVYQLGSESPKVCSVLLKLGVPLRERLLEFHHPLLVIDRHGLPLPTLVPSVSR